MSRQSHTHPGHGGTIAAANAYRGFESAGPLPWRNSPLRCEMRHPGARVALSSWLGRSEFARQRRLRYSRGAPFPCGDQSFLRQRLVSHPVASLAPLRLTALPHSKLDTLWHNRCAGGASYPYRHPSFLRQRRVSAWVASLATLGIRHVLQHATHPRGRHSSHTQDLHAYVPTLTLCHRPRCSEVALIIMTAAMA